jgi:hypothetical protein
MCPVRIGTAPTTWQHRTHTVGPGSPVWPTDAFMLGDPLWTSCSVLALRWLTRSSHSTLPG